MKKQVQLAACMLFLIAFCGTFSLPQGLIDVASSKPVVFSVDHGRFHCDSCHPVIDVPANGMEQPVNGYADGRSYDTISVKIVDSRTLEVTTKRAGRFYFKQISAVAADGDTLDVKTTEDTGIGGANGVAIAVRVGPAPAGAHAASGSWRVIRASGSVD
jgi:hypothetical protein